MKPVNISIIVNFFNMRREAERTLFSMTKAYQNNSADIEYEVLAVDNGSSLPLDPEWVAGFGDGFKYLYYESGNTSPCQAINHAAKTVAGDYVMICIDGARILSPGILNYTRQCLKLHGRPFVYTLGMHIGEKPQNYLVDYGYNQAVEDKLLSEIDWRSNGYRLFGISSLGLSSKNGYFSEVSESNCFTMKKRDFLEMGGLDESFTGLGGGLANLDFFNRVHANLGFSPIMLLGEATFHQFHGGVASNAPLDKHPWDEMAREYREIKGRAYKKVYRPPEYHGFVSNEYHSKLIPFL